MTATFVDSLNLPGGELSFANCKVEENLKKCDDTWIKDKSKYDWSNPEPGNQDAIDCYHNARANYDQCEKATAAALEQRSAAQGTWTGVLNILISGFFGTILLIVAAFTLFAGAIMLLFRILAIWFLVMIVPLAFICYIMPSLNNNWKKWWSTFLNWCIFAPAYSFFIWLAIRICVNNANVKLATSVNDTFTGFIGNSGNPFLQNPGEQLLGYALIIGLLLGGLIVAKQLGIYGADAAMKIATNARKGATNWMKRTAMRPIKGVSTTIGAEALKVGSKLFGGDNTKLGRRMGAKAAQVKQSATQTKENKNYTNLLKTMTDENVLREVETANGSRKLIATQEAKRRGLLGEEAGRKTVEEAMKAMRAYGDEEGLRSLEEVRPDAIENETKQGAARQDAAIERAIKNGTHKKWSKEVFKTPLGKKIARRLTEQLGSEFNNVYNGYSKATKEEIDRALRENFDQNFNSNKSASGKEQNYNLEARRSYAKATGDIYTAFTDSGGKDTWLAKEYIQGLSAEYFAKFNNLKSKQMAGRYMTEKQVYGVGIAVTSGKDKEIMMLAAEEENKPIYEIMETSEVWGGKKPKPAPDSTSTPVNNTVDLREQQRIAREKEDERRRKG